MSCIDSKHHILNAVLCIAGQNGRIRRCMQNKDYNSVFDALERQAEQLDRIEEKIKECGKTKDEVKA